MLHSHRLNYQIFMYFSYSSYYSLKHTVYYLKNNNNVFFLQEIIFTTFIYNNIYYL